MVAPVESIAAAIHEANRAYLDGLPGITLDGADRIIASLRKKVSPLIVTPPPTAIRAPRSERDEMRQDAITLLTQLGARRPEAQRGIDQLLDTREDLTSLQDLITEYFKAQHARTSGTG
jgi:Holliday junction resolvasome RuvABC DNA-binding subunit